MRAFVHSIACVMLAGCIDVDALSQRYDLGSDLSGSVLDASRGAGEDLASTNHDLASSADDLGHSPCAVPAPFAPAAAGDRALAIAWVGSNTYLIAQVDGKNVSYVTFDTLHGTFQTGATFTTTASAVQPRASKAPIVGKTSYLSYVDGVTMHIASIANGQVMLQDSITATGNIFSSDVARRGITWLAAYGVSGESAVEAQLGSSSTAQTITTGANAAVRLASTQNGPQALVWSDASGTYIALINQTASADATSLVGTSTSVFSYRVNALGVDYIPDVALVAGTVPSDLGTNGQLVMALSKGGTTTPIATSSIVANGAAVAAVPIGVAARLSTFVLVFADPAGGIDQIVVDPNLPSAPSSQSIAMGSAPHVAADPTVEGEYVVAYFDSNDQARIFVSGCTP